MFYPKVKFDMSVQLTNSENGVAFGRGQTGYRHFDTARVYGSEPAVGNALTEAIQDGVIKREDVFVTSKLWGSDFHDPVSALHQTLK